MSKAERDRYHVHKQRERAAAKKRSIDEARLNRGPMSDAEYWAHIAALEDKNIQAKSTDKNIIGGYVMEKSYEKKVRNLEKHLAKKFLAVGDKGF